MSIPYSPIHNFPLYNFTWYFHLVTPISSYFVAYKKILDTSQFSLIKPSLLLTVSLTSFHTCSLRITAERFSSSSSSMLLRICFLSLSYWRSHDLWRRDSWTGRMFLPRIHDYLLIALRPADIKGVMYQMQQNNHITDPCFTMGSDVVFFECFFFLLSA